MAVAFSDPESSTDARAAPQDQDGRHRAESTRHTAPHRIAQVTKQSERPTGCSLARLLPCALLALLLSGSLEQERRWLFGQVKEEEWSDLARHFLQGEMRT